MRCPKCDGKGYIDVYAYHQQGVCFECNGTGVVAGKSGGKFKFAAKHFEKALPGLNKVQTAMYYQDTWDGDAETYLASSNLHKDYAVLVASGLYEVTCGDFSREYGKRHQD